MKKLRKPTAAFCVNFFWLSDLKFLAEMGLLLTLLMTFNKFGGLIVVPALVNVLRPPFFTSRKPKAVAVEPKVAVASYGS